MKRTREMKVRVGVVAGILLAGSFAASVCYGDTKQVVPGVDIEGSALFLAMGRDYGGDNKGESASASIRLSASSQLAESVALRAEYLRVENLWENGREGAPYWLSNDNISLLNEFHLDFDLARAGLSKSKLQIGRQLVSYDFFAPYKVRHKAQSMEGLVFKTSAIDGISLDIGHIERYSSWPCREGGTSALNSEFMSISERLGFAEGDSGVQFVSAKWKQGDAWDFSVYDYYVNEFYNNAGLKVAYALRNANRTGDWIVSWHVVSQSGEGYMSTHEADAMELNLRYKLGGLTLDSGWTHVANASSLAVPFRTSFAIDATLLWYTSQFEAATDSLHLKMAYKKGAWALVGVLVDAKHADDRREQECDLVVKRSFENGLWAAFKGGYGHRDFADFRDSERATDLRLFVGYDF